MLAEASTMEDFRGVRDLATAAQTWAKARKLGIDAENEAAEVVLRAERAIGGELIRMVEAGERASEHGNNRRTPKGLKVGTPESVSSIQAGSPTLPTLKDLGIPSSTAYYWQALARMPDDTFETMLREVKSTGKRIAKVNFYAPVERAWKAAKQAKVVSEEAAPKATPALAAWMGASRVLLEGGLSSLPTDELVEFAKMLMELVNAYNVTRMARS